MENGQYVIQFGKHVSGVIKHNAKWLFGGYSSCTWRTHSKEFYLQIPAPWHEEELEMIQYMPWLSILCLTSIHSSKHTGIWGQDKVRRISQVLRNIGHQSHGSYSIPSNWMSILSMCNILFTPPLLNKRIFYLPFQHLPRASLKNHS